MRELKFKAWDGKIMRPWGFLYAGCFVGIPTESNAMNYPQMQYTNLNDKNGKEIYFGDFLKLPDSKEIHEVMWGDDFNIEFRIIKTTIYTNANNYKINNHKGCNDLDVEVIGNIYENPELLEGNNE